MCGGSSRRDVKCREVRAGDGCVCCARIVAFSTRSSCLLVVQPDHDVRHPAPLQLLDLVVLRVLPVAGPAAEADAV